MKAVILTVGFCCTVGCSDNDSDLIIYVPDAGTAVKVDFYTEGEPYAQIFNVAVTPGTYPQPTEYGLFNDAAVYLRADPGKVDEYNMKNGTEYRLLPEAAYDLTEEVLVKTGIPRSEDVVITVYVKGDIEVLKEYLLPVSIVSVEGAAADDCYQTIHFIFRGSIDASNTGLLDRTGWEVPSASSGEPKEGDWGHSGLKKACLGDDLDAFWGTDWNNQRPQSPHQIVIDLKKTTHIQGFACQVREEDYDDPKEMTVEVSEDNTTWTVAAKFKDIPAQGEFRFLLPDAVDERYLKVTITAVNGGPHATVNELNLF